MLSANQLMVLLWGTDVMTSFKMLLNLLCIDYFIIIFLRTSVCTGVIVVRLLCIYLFIWGTDVMTSFKMSLNLLCIDYFIIIFLRTSIYTGVIVLRLLFIYFLILGWSATIYPKGMAGCRNIGKHKLERSIGATSDKGVYGFLNPDRPEEYKQHGIGCKTKYEPKVDCTGDNIGDDDY